MTIIQKRVEQLTAIFKVWNENDPENQQKTINYLSEFLTSASLLQKISGDENLKEQLELFNENFQRNFRADLKKLGESDLPEDLVTISQEIRKIDDTDLPPDEKRTKVAEIFSKHHLSRDEFVERISEQTQNKYQFAHLRNALNYGEYVNFLAIELGDNPANQELKDSVSSTLQSIKSTDSETEFFANLVKLNQALDLSRNFDKLKTRFNLDGMEEHSLINQGTQFRSNLDQIQIIQRIESEEGENFTEKTKNFFRGIQELKKNQKIVHSFQTQEFSSPVATFLAGDSSSSLAQQITYGYEMEAVITAKGGLEPERLRLEGQSDYERIVYHTADLDSRAKMRDTYGFSSEKIGRNINPLLLYSETELETFRQLNYQKNSDKINVVRNFLQNEKLKFSEDNQKIVNQAIENIALLTKEEIYFFELFFVKKSEAQKHRLTMDDVFDWRDDDENHQKKLLSILKDIALGGGFYKKTLDMIRASEIAIGEFESDEADLKLSEAIKYIRENAAKHDLSTQDRNVQVNIGLSIDGENQIRIYDETSDGKLRLFSNELTGDFAKTIQQALIQTIQNNPEFERRGQGLVGIGVKADRKKGLIAKTRDTEYFVYYNQADPDIGLSPESSAFPVHRRNTGKSENIRLAIIGENESAVFEVRLIANNPHCPYFDDQPRIVDNACEKFAKTFKENLEQKWQEYLADKTPEQIQAKIQTRIAIDKDGNLAGASTEIQNPALVAPPTLKVKSIS